MGARALAALNQIISPALAEIIGGRRLWTVSMISAVSDSVEIDGRDSQVHVAELPLDHLQRDALAGHLDGVGVAQLVWCEAPAHAGPRCIRGHSDGRMSTRGFGALHIGIALGTLRAAARNESCRELALLNLACALGDTAATLLERRERGAWDPVVRGSVSVDVVDVAWWTNALRYV